MKTLKLACVALFSVFCCLFANTTMAQTKTLTAVAAPAVWATGTWTNGLPAIVSNKVEFIQVANTVPLSTIDNTYYSRRLQNQNSGAAAGADMVISSNSAENAVVLDVNADVFYTGSTAPMAVLHTATAAAGTKFTIDCNLKISNTFTTTSANRHNILKVVGSALNVLEFGPNSIIENVGFGAIAAYPQLGTILMNGEIKGTGTFICGTGGTPATTNPVAPANFFTGFTVFGPTSNNPNFNAATNSITLVSLADVTVNTNVGNTFFKNTAGGKLQFNNFPTGASAKITFNTANVWNSILRSSTGSSNGDTGANLVINADQTTNVGAIEMVQAVISTVPTGAPVINLTVADGKSVTFGESSANVWSAGSKLNIYGFDGAASIKFGTTDAALTAAQLGMIVIKDGASAGKAVGLDATGKLVLATLSTKDNFAQFGFKSYPNPAKNVINLSAAKTINTVSFFNVLGQKVQSNTVNAAQKQVDISNLQKGVYVMDVTIDNAKHAFKIVKQ